MEFRGQEQEPIHHEVEMGASSTPHAAAPVPPSSSSSSEVRYHECLRNHAAALGGHVVDGCGEFMPGDDALKCAACGCHRSFHRKDDGQQRRGVSLTAAPAPRVPLLMPPPPLHPAYPHPRPFPYHGTTPSGTTTTESSSEERVPPSAQQAGQQPARRKRFRTKFTPEQKDQMLAFAERLGWRMQKQDEALVEQFCSQVGVRRQVFKVWMHNNKHISRRPQQEHQSQQHQQQQQQP